MIDGTQFSIRYPWSSAMIEDVIRMMKTGVVIEAPEVIIDPNVVY